MSAEAETLLDLIVSWVSDELPSDRTISANAPESPEPQTVSDIAAVFGLSKPSVHLEWRYLVLAKLTLALLGTDEARHILKRRESTSCPSWLTRRTSAGEFD